MADKCPWCGADKIPVVEGNPFIKYQCETQPGHRTHKCKDRQIAQLKARTAKLERVAEAAETLLQEKIILDTVCFPHSLFKKYQELSDALKDLEVPR